MNKILKYLLLGVGGVGAVLIAVAADLAMTFDPNDYKPQIVELVKAKLNRTLTIEGDIRLLFYPKIDVDLGGVSLSEPASEKEFAAIGRARVALQLMPLLSQELVVNQIELRGLRVNLVKGKDGSNLDVLAGSEGFGQKRPEGGDDAATRRPIRFNIDHVLVDNASLSYLDEGSGAKYTMNGLNLKTGKISSSAPIKIELGMTLGASQPKVNLDARIKTRLAVAFDSRRFMPLLCVERETSFILAHRAAYVSRYDKSEIERAVAVAV